jgi:hypothetical protein
VVVRLLDAGADDRLVTHNLIGFVPAPDAPRRPPSAT